MPEFIIKNKNITVSGGFIENIMPELNGAFVKVYLYMLMLAESGRRAENSDIAARLGLLESEVVQAVKIFCEYGLISADNEKVVFEKGSSFEQPSGKKVNEQPKETPEAVKTKPQAEKVQYSVTEMEDVLKNNKSLSDMLKVAQEVIGKPLNNADTNTLFWFYDGLGLSPEVILMLLEYCVSSEKRSMAYIEKVAIAWSERGINTMEDAEKLIDDERESKSYMQSIKRIIGINDRGLTKIEENFLNEWKNGDKMSEEMVALAYEYCILQINKLSFPYMNKIIKRWKSMGILTVEAAEADAENFKSKRGSSVINKSGAGYDYDSIEKKMWDNL